MLIFLIVLAVVAAIAERWSLSHGLDNVTYSLTPDRLVVEPEEKFNIITRIENRKRLPVSFLEVKEMLPKEITPTDEAGLTVYRDAENTCITSTMFIAIPSAEKAVSYSVITLSSFHSEE